MIPANLKGATIIGFRAMNEEEGEAIYGMGFHNGREEYNIVLELVTVSGELMLITAFDREEQERPGAFGFNTAREGGLVYINSQKQLCMD